MKSWKSVYMQQKFIKSKLLQEQLKKLNSIVWPEIADLAKSEILRYSKGETYKNLPLFLTLYSIIRPFDALKYHVFEKNMENGAFAISEQMLHFP